jgi:hypothetical protein
MVSELVELRIEGITHNSSSRFDKLSDLNFAISELFEGLSTLNRFYNIVDATELEYIAQINDVIGFDSQIIFLQA